MSFFKEAIARQLGSSSRVGGDRWTRQNRRDIDRLDEATDYMQQGNQGAIEGIMRRIKALERQVKHNTDQLEQATLLNEALVELIVAREWASPSEVASFIEKVEDEWERERETEADTEAPDPSTATEPSSVPQTTCASCGSEVPTRETYISELGNVCQSCHF